MDMKANIWYSALEWKVTVFSIIYFPASSYPCDTHEIQGKPRDYRCVSYLGHSILYYINYWILHVWHTPGGSGWRVCHQPPKGISNVLYLGHADLF